MKNVVILLTATVKPGNMIFTELTDPESRQSQYLSSLNHWLRKTTLPIVLVENSGTDLSVFFNETDQKRIEFLTFKGNDFSRDLGKGYGELNCLKYAYEKSVFLQAADFIFKVTGRYVIENFGKFYDHYLSHDDIYTFLDLKENLKTADSKIFGFHPDFLPRYLFKRHEQINDSLHVVFEHVLSRATLESIIENRKFEQFITYPRILGTSGTTNQPYETDFFFMLRKQIEIYLKAILIKR